MTFIIELLALSGSFLRNVWQVHNQDSTSHFSRALPYYRCCTVSVDIYACFKQVVWAIARMQQIISFRSQLLWSSVTSSYPALWWESTVWYFDRRRKRSTWSLSWTSVSLVSYGTIDRESGLFFLIGGFKRGLGNSCMRNSGVCTHPSTTNIIFYCFNIDFIEFILICKLTVGAKTFPF